MPTYISSKYATGEAVDAALNRALAAPQFHGFEGRSGSSLSTAGTVLSLVVPSAQSVWLDGTEYTLTEGLSLDLGEIPDNGGHFIVAQDDGAGALELAEIPAAWSITNTNYTPTVIGYWNGSAFAVQEERHGHSRNLENHEYLHKTVGARIQNDGSFAQIRPSTANDGHLELVAGSLWDEDIENEISTAKGKLVRNWYEMASGVWTWVDGVNNAGYDRPYLWNSGTSLLRYPNTGSAYALTDCASNRYIVVWAYASNDVDRPIYIVTPAVAATYTTVANARAALAPVLPFAPELKLLYRWIYRGDGEYKEAADYRTASSLPSGGVTAPVAASVSFVPSGALAATNVQTALEELDDEKTALTDFALLQQQVNELASIDAPQGSGTYLVSGATIAWVSGYTYRVGAAIYRIGGVEITSVEQEVTLAAAHETLPRIDVLVLDANGILSTVIGTAGESPAQPTVEPDEYYVVTFVSVAADSTESDVITTNIYTEGTEWTATASAASITVGSTNNPRTGTKSIEGTAVAGNTYVTAVATEALDPNQQNNLVFYVRHKVAWPSQKAIRLTWFNGTAQRGNAFVVGNGAYGLNTQVAGAYQQVVVPMSAFAIPAGLTADRLRWEVTGGGASVGFYLDDWLLQAGVSGQQAPVVLFAGAWIATRVYSVNQIVERNGSSYIALTASLNEDPAASPLWGQLGIGAYGVVGSYRNTVATSVSGALTTTAHSGKHLITSGNVTIPNAAGDVGFTATIQAGGAHTITFNSTTSAALATGDVATAIVTSTTTIILRKSAAADQVALT